MCSADNDKPPFRILALDGGGIKGAFTASILATWENETGLNVVDHFDLIAGTSTGGILALALGLGHPASDILEFYKKDGPKIFPNSAFLQQLGLMVGHLWRPKYSQEPLRAALASVFANKKFGDSKCRLLIPTYDALRGRIFLMKTAHHARFSYDYNASAVDIALATSAAPTFFKPSELEEHEGNVYIDGGVWANCPALAAVVEAHHFLGAALPSIQVLSIGTTSESSATLNKLDRGPLSWLSYGALRWAPRLLGVMFQAQMENALSTASLLTQGNLYRVDQITPEGAYSLDSIGKIRNLIQLGRSRAVEKEVIEHVQKHFLNGVLATPFRPLHPISPDKSATK
jgi:predicted acylesterase/phospholipase RssA